MQIVGLDKISAFINGHPDSEASLTSWIAHIKSVTWNNSGEVKQSYRTADPIKNNRVVFNIQHNKYQLIVKINYAYHIVEIRFIDTHKEYVRIIAVTI
jgi:mRNA interferase HigB